MQPQDSTDSGHNLGSPLSGQAQALTPQPNNPTSPSGSMPPVNSPLSAAQPVLSTVPQVAKAAAPAMAEDADLIEKEWVEAVQHVMAATKGDPFQQTQAINALKVDYLKKRYNKDIKAAGE